MIKVEIKVECFWSGIQSGNEEHNRNAECLKKLKEENTYQKKECLTFTKEIVSKQSRKIINWKAPGRDGVQGFWINKSTSLHERPAFQFNKILNGNEILRDWHFCAKKIKLKVMFWIIVVPPLVCH